MAPRTRRSLPSRAAKAPAPSGGPGPGLQGARGQPAAEQQAGKADGGSTTTSAHGAHRGARRASGAKVQRQEEERGEDEEAEGLRGAQKVATRAPAGRRGARRALAPRTARAAAAASPSPSRSPAPRSRSRAPKASTAHLSRQHASRSPSRGLSPPPQHSPRAAASPAAVSYLRALSMSPERARVPPPAPAGARVGLLRCPWRTLSLFAASVSEGLLWALARYVSHPLAVGSLAAAAAGLVGLRAAGLDDAADEAQAWALFGAWWLLLGILSSVGLGSGMHSGLLFLWPHALQVSLAAERCGHMHFDARADVWGSAAGKAMPCLSPPSAEWGEGQVPFWALYRKVILACVLWGFGTALGEIPPYALCYSAALAGGRSEEVDSMLDESEEAPISIAGRWWEAMKRWTVYLLKHHGFVGVLLLASWPNAAFDMAGMACGHFLMDFWTFFVATAIGKGLVKVHGQALLFIYLFVPATRKLFLAYWTKAFAALEGSQFAELAQAAGAPSPAIWGGIVETQLEAYIATLRDPVIDSRWFWQRWADEGLSSVAKSLVPSPFAAATIALVAFFVVTTIHQLAQQRADQLAEAPTMAKKKDK